MRLLITLALFVGVFCASEVRAEPHLYLLIAGDRCFFPARCPLPRPRVVEVELPDGRITREWSIPAASVGEEGTNLSVSADGRFLFWVDQPSPTTSAKAVRVLDLTTGDMSVGGQWIYYPTLHTHPTEVRAIVRGFESRIVQIDPSGERQIAIPDCAVGIFEGISGDGTRALSHCSSSAVNPPRSLVTDLTTGNVVGASLPRILGFERSFLDERGDEVIALEPTSIPSTGEVMLRKLNVASGLEMMRFTYTGNWGKAYFDRRTNRAFVTNGK